MKVLLIAPFIVMNYPKLRSADRYKDAVDRLAAQRLHDFRTIPMPAESAVTIDPDHPLAGAALNCPLLHGSFTVEPESGGKPSARGASPLEVELLVGKLGVGFFVVATNTGRLVGATDLENLLIEPLRDVVATVSG